MQLPLFLVALAGLASAAVLGGKKEGIAVHGHGVVKASQTQTQTQTHRNTLAARAPVTTVAPKITDPAWINGVLSRIDLWRQQHSAAPLVWSQTLAQYALNASNACKLAHTGGPHGENIYWISSAAIDHYTQMKKGIDAWGDEYKLYDAGNPYAEGALHFTALVWKNAKSVGCAWSATTCPKAGGGGWYLFCEFDPVTNVMGQFAANVEAKHVVS